MASAGVGPELTAGAIAARLEGALEGDPAVTVSGVAGLRDAVAGDVSYLVDARYAAHAATTAASILLVSPSWRGATAAPAVLRVADPVAAFTRLVEWFSPPEPPLPVGVHPSAVVASDAELGADVAIGPCVVVESGAHIGARSVLRAGCYVGHGVRLGSDCSLYPHVCLREHVRIGDRAILHAGVVIGSDGYGYEVQREGANVLVRKIPQRGIVVIGDDVEVGANTTIDRARFGATRIGRSVKIDNLVMVAHNVSIGDCSGLAGQVGIAGSTRVGSGCMLLGKAGVVGHLEIGDGVTIGGHATVTKDVPPGAHWSGDPARPHREVQAARAHLARLPRQQERLVALERRVQELERLLAARERDMGAT